MIHRRQVWVTGFLATAVYLAGTALAWSHYPLAFSPFTNWLSDLGNPGANPGGAFAYNLGVVLTGLCLILFCLGLETWNNADRRRMILVRLMQGMGILAFLALIVSGLFPLGTHTLVHQVSGKAHIFFVGFFLACSVSILFRLAHAPKGLAFLAILAALINFIYGVFLYSVFMAEWVAIGAFIIYILVISVYSIKQNTT
jgi:hypothetical membrane protein